MPCSPSSRCRNSNGLTSSARAASRPPAARRSAGPSGRSARPRARDRNAGCARTSRGCSRSARARCALKTVFRISRTRPARRRRARSRSRSRRRAARRRSRSAPLMMRISWWPSADITIQPGSMPRMVPAMNAPSWISLAPATRLTTVNGAIGISRMAAIASTPPLTMRRCTRLSRGPITARSVSRPIASADRDRSPPRSPASRPPHRRAPATGPKAAAVAAIRIVTGNAISPPTM